MRNNLGHCSCMEGRNRLGVGHGFQVNQAKRLGKRRRHKYITVLLELGQRRRFDIA